LEQKRPALFEVGLQRGRMEPIVSVQLASVEPDFIVDQCLILDNDWRDRLLHLGLGTCDF
jgi:hypothetical protein